ncbi:MAG TPA: MBL fold metallo-hydrolase [Acidobacteriota bacterium]|nr:MBL fold metallo-hydrolase [Acidobacteriota bacterium]
MRWGDFNLELVSDGCLWLDGGAMFGVVPKPLWSRTTPCDDANRIRLGMNCLLVQSAQINLLIDTGCGDLFSDKEKKIYRIEREKRLSEQLADRAGLQPRDIDIVVNTHLHFDHAGGNTSRDAEKGLQPTFPKARYIVQRRELHEAEHTTERNQASYNPDNWRPLEESGQLETVEGQSEIIPGVTVIPTPGHTLGHQSVLIESGDRQLFYIADLCPTQAHVPLPWIMGYDLFPLTTLETRKKIYPRALAEQWVVFFEHDPDRPCGWLTRDQGRYGVENLDLFQ